MLRPITGRWPIHLFISQTDIPDADALRKTKFVIPRRPVFASAISFTILSSCAYLLKFRKTPGIRIGTEGAFPFCDICYAHFCHRFFLARHRKAIGGGTLRRVARLFTHSWGAASERIAFRSARTIVVPSQGLARELQAAYPNLVERKIRVIPNPVDTEYFSRPPGFDAQPILQRLQVPPDAFVLSFCALGAFERKGLRFVLEALAGLRDQNVWLLVIGGSPGEIRDFQRLAQQLRVDSAVRFVGLQVDIRPFLWSSNAFVFPSEYEGFALASLQAAAAGLPLITTLINGTEEFIINGVNGWVVERNASSIQAAVRNALEAPGLTADMGNVARENVQKYKEQHFQAQWLALLEEENAR